MFEKMVATVLFTDDLDGCQSFYQNILELPLAGRDADSASFLINNQYLMFLKKEEAARLLDIEVTRLTGESVPRTLLAVNVENVDAAYQTLKSKGVSFLRPPTDQSWGLRTAHFADPEGNLWEIHQPIGPESETE